MRVFHAVCVCVVTGTEPADDGVPCCVCVCVCVCVVTGTEPADDGVPCCVCVCVRVCVCCDRYRAS